MALNSSNMTIKPMRVTFGEDRAQQFAISCGADVASSLQNDYFWIFDETGNDGFYVWFNVGGSGVDPNPAIPLGATSKTAVPVAIAVSASASVVAAAVQSAIDALTDFIATVSTSLVTVTNAANGVSRAPFRGVGCSDFEWKVTRTGSVAEEVGYVDGEITVTTGEEIVDITAHQLGASVIGGFVTGRTLEASVVLKETSKAKLKKMMLAGGGDSTSGQGSGSEVFGYGSDKLFTNTFTQAQKMVMHPFQLPSADLSEDITFWKAYPMIEDLTFSGEDIFNIPVSFKIYPDTSKVGAAQYMVVGDSTQTFTL